MKAIQYVKSIPGYFAVKLLGSAWPSVATSSVGCVRLSDLPEPPLPGPRWVRVRPILSGICGSDLATVFAKGSPYFSPFTSTPFVLGHETVGRVIETGPEVERVREGERVVLEPALGCEVRGIDPPCTMCARGDYACCENVTKGDISAGIQTGYCRDTGGAWSEGFVAHESQLHPVPDDVPDEAAVLAEPLSCAIHTALEVRPKPDDRILMIGAGSMGLLTLSALRYIGVENPIIVSAWLPQQRDRALNFGATEVIMDRGTSLYRRAADRISGDLYQPEVGKPILLGGPEITIDCVGSGKSVHDALRLTRAGGTVLLVGMPGIPWGIDWTTIWHKELTIRGCYAYGMESWNGEPIRTFELAIRYLQTNAADLSPLVGGNYRLDEVREALATAIGARKAAHIKTVFAIDEN
jgi:threonine dehydrogenase-like Zn-dependent dehydrogenase